MNKKYIKIYIVDNDDTLTLYVSNQMIVFELIKLYQEVISSFSTESYLIFANKILDMNISLYDSFIIDESVLHFTNCSYIH